MAAPIWQAGTTLLRRYMPVDKPVARLVLVPSLINGAAILDITPSHSFCKALADQGIVVDLIDWQSPGDVECEFTLQDYNLKRVLPAVVENPIQGLPL